MSQQHISAAERERRMIVRAGIFIALGLSLAALVIFVLGRERNLFDKENTYIAAFENVDGLQLDSPVRLGGLQVGRVSSIAFAHEIKDQRIIVTMEVARKFSERIRTDSVARVTGRGVLGDKAIDISLGTPPNALVPDKGELTTGSSGDIATVLKATGEIVDNAVGITRDLRDGVAVYTNETMRTDVVAVVKSVRNIVEEIEKGKGLLHLLVYDKSLSDEVRVLVGEVAQSAVRLDAAVLKVDGLLVDIKSGGGTLQALLYDKKAANAVVELGLAAEELTRLIHDAKTTKDGAVYQLVYGDSRKLFGDLGQAAADVKAMTAKIKQGEGSLGGIINDPTVYEDLKEVLGNVKRNRVLRELVRMSISNGEKIEEAGKPAGP